MSRLTVPTDSNISSVSKIMLDPRICRKCYLDRLHDLVSGVLFSKKIIKICEIAFDKALHFGVLGCCPHTNHLDPPLRFDEVDVRLLEQIYATQKETSAT